ncbi:MAG: META domain-containing protein [Pseudomonadota bacterium]
MIKILFSSILILLMLNACMEKNSEFNTPVTVKDTKIIASLTDTYWKLLSLNGQAVSLREGEKEVSMVLASEKSSIRGFSGCNRFFGSFMKNNVNNQQIKFSKLASTRKMCKDNMQQEREFLKVLSLTTSYKTSAESLFLYNKNNQVIAQFESRYMH